MAYILKIKVDKIYIYPLGGISKFDMKLNISPLKEFLVLIAGPITQNIAYILLINIFKTDKELILIYHLSLLVFNLLPIYPLDGGKLLNLLFNKILPYKYSFKLTIKISYILVLIIFLLQTNIKINIIIMSLFLLTVIHKEELKIEYTYNKFLLERTLYNFKFKKKKIIKNINNFYRNKAHIIKEHDKYYLEKDFLEKKYKNFKKNVDTKNSVCYNSITGCEKD